ncbi:MAG: 16S rRNA (uracil(1498)-N(3))-methyltransferase [Bacteroidales bacterium]|nr:16S rRNA (uracil(1498)-N(3))-methyltransferase [Bacteroidales bacterium]
MDLFYVPWLQWEDETATLSEEESTHIVRVLRQKVGDMILLTNGKGGRFVAEITIDHPKHTEVMIADRIKIPKDEYFHLHLLMAPTKNIARFEWFLEKACEIGVDEITPLLTEHTEHRKLNSDRLQRVLVAAMKQSQTMWMPQLNPLTDIASVIECEKAEHRFVGWCGDETQGELFDLCPMGGNIAVLIGPEGDFSEQEIYQLKKSDFIPVSMGQKRLRTETAGVVACTTINIKNRLQAR